MPYSTSNNPGMAQAANAIARIFVGDPAADAEYSNQAIKNETEMQRQRLLAEQVVTEGVQRKQIEAAAAANNALAAGRTRENSAYNDLGNLFTQDLRDFNAPGGMSVPGDAPAGTPGAGFDLNNPAIAAQVLAPVMRGGIDPKVLSSMALMPGQSDDVLGRIMTGSGQMIGKDDYVSVGDRNTNRRFEVGGNERLVDGTGSVQLGLDPTQAAANTGLANQRNATAGRQNALAKQGGAGGKVPRLDQTQMNSMLRAALQAQGANIPVNGDVATPIAQYLSPQPDLYSDMSRVIDEAYRLSGGRASAVQDALSQYLSGMDFSTFGQTGGMFRDAPAPIQRPDLNMILQQIQQMYGPNAIAPEIFTEGGDGDLPNLQNVGNMQGWGLESVEK